MSDVVSITVFENGPYKVSNAKSAEYCGEAIDASGDIFLCRCGQSSNAPFCDGTHNKIGFQGHKEVTKQREVRVWEGKTIRTRFNSNICMHARYCKPLNDLRERELAGDAAAATEIARVVQTCPSGALTWEAKGPVAEPAPGPTHADIVIVEGGEIRLRGDFEIDEPLPEHQGPGRATLCRCGLSRNKPWCDGMHASRKDFRCLRPWTAHRIRQAACQVPPSSGPPMTSAQ